MSKPSAHSQGDFGRAHLASVFPSGQWAVAQSPAVLGAREMRSSAPAPGQKEVPPSHREPTCVHSACAEDSEVAGSSPRPVASFLGEPVSIPGPLLIPELSCQRLLKGEKPPFPSPVSLVPSFPSPFSSFSSSSPLPFSSCVSSSQYL